MSEKCKKYFLEKINEIEINRNNSKEKSEEELNEWMKLSEEHLLALQNLQKVCFYCSVKMTPESINTECLINNSKTDLSQCKYLIKSQDLQKINHQKNFTQHQCIILESPMKKQQKRLKKIYKLFHIN